MEQNGILHRDGHTDDCFEQVSAKVRALRQLALVHPQEIRPSMIVHCLAQASLVCAEIGGDILPPRGQRAILATTNACSDAGIAARTCSRKPYELKKTAVTSGVACPTPVMCST